MTDHSGANQPDAYFFHIFCPFCQNDLIISDRLQYPYPPEGKNNLTNYIVGNPLKVKDKLVNNLRK